MCGTIEEFKYPGTIVIKKNDEGIEISHRHKNANRTFFVCSRLPDCKFLSHVTKIRMYKTIQPSVLYVSEMSILSRVVGCGHIPRVPRSK